MTTRTHRCLGSMALALMLTHQAWAQAFIIDFDDFAVPAPFVGGVENGFQITPSGDPLVTEINNNGVFANVTVGNQTTGTTSFLTVTHVSGGDFEFASIAGVRFGSDTGQVRIEGFRNGVSVGVDAFGVPTAPDDPEFWFADNLVATPVDEIKIRIRGGDDGRMFIDRLEVMPIVQSVPDARFWSIDARTLALYDIDLAARTATLVTPTGGNGDNIPDPGGAAALNNSLYHTNPDLSDNVGLHRIDVERGEIELIGPNLVPGDQSDALTADPVTGTVIGIGDSDTLYITKLFDGETAETPSGVLSANVGAAFGRATGAAFDSGTGTVYVATEETPSGTVQLWSFPIDDVNAPGFQPTFIGDTGIFAFGALGGMGFDAQIGLAFDDASDTLVMSSGEGLTARFYLIDTATAAPSFVFSTPDRLALDSLAPQHLGYEVVADSAGPGEIPVALTADQRSGQVYAADDGSLLTRVQSGELVVESFFPTGFAPGGTDIEYADFLDTGAPSAVFCVDDVGAMVILPSSGSPFSFPLAPQGVTTGPEVGMARRGENLYFTSGMGVPGALYQFDPRTGTATLVSTNIEDDASTLEYVEATDTFYYATGDSSAVYAYDLATDASVQVGSAYIGSFTPNFAIDPEARFAYYAEDDRIVAISLEPGDLVRFVYADNLPMNRNGQHDLVFAPSSSGFGMSLFVATNGRQDPAPPQVLEFAGFPAPQPACPGDADDDLDVDLSDLALVLSQFGATGGGLAGDVNSDGSADLEDLAIVLANFGRSCPP